MSQNSLLEELNKQPAALKTTVEIHGVISLSDEDADRLDMTNKALSGTLMELSLLSNNVDLPSQQRSTRLLALQEPVMTSADALLEIVTHATLELTRPAFVAEARKLLDEIKGFRDHIVQLFDDFVKMDEPKKLEIALKRSQEVSNAVLTVLEKVMELLAVPDRATLAAIDEACDLLAERVRFINKEFIEGRSQAEITNAFTADPSRVRALVDASQMFVVHVTTCLRAFSNRIDVITFPEAKTALQNGMTMLQGTAPRLMNIAQGSVPNNGEADTILNFLDKAKEYVRKVPAFSARVFAEFVDGSKLGITANNLASAVERGLTSDIGDAARKYALEVTSVISQCRAIGVDPMECDMAQAALADVIKLAKIAAQTGDPEDYKKFKSALDYLNTMVRGLPKKFSRQLYEESSAAFEAAREMSKGSLLDFVNSFQK